MTQSLLHPQSQASGAREYARRLRIWLQPQVSSGAREQRDQAVLLLAVAVVVAPHFGHLPLWSVVTIGALWIWRAWLTQSLKPAPGRFVMLVLLALCTAGVWLEHGTLFGRRASVNFLLVLIGLKILEMRARRDVLVIVFLSLFVLQTQYLFDESILSAIVMLTSVFLLFFVLLGVNLPEGDISLSGKVRYLTRVFVLAAPLTLALFFLFPRLPAPLWHGIGDEPRAGSGLSDSMSPGSISQLLRNDAVALRAKFEERVPEQRNLYWRGPVFGLFDGRSWSPLIASRTPAAGAASVRYVPASGVEYTVTLEPTQRRELLALEFAESIDEVPTSNSRLTSTLELQTAAPVVSRLRYRVRSYLSFATGPTRYEPSLSEWLQLPTGYNPRTLRWANDLKARTLSLERVPAAGATGPEQRLVNAVLAHFRSEPFHYSINAPLLGRDSVDEFLFGTRTGFCEHYASSFVVLMRAMGIPARVVTGYQGGEVNPIDGYLTVRQSDAHAWAEVWMQNRGWLRVDPTAAVAPNRIEHTLRERRSEELEGAREGWGWFSDWRANREALENAWNQWILSYSAERQLALMTRLGLHADLENVAAVAIAAMGILLIMLAFVSVRHRPTRDPLAELVSQLRAKLARSGIQLPTTMGLQTMEQALAKQLDPACMPDLHRMLADISAARYERPATKGAVPNLRGLRLQLRLWRPIRLAR
ncbi:MAG TPA: DUF3488 and transglutaminase-like domain-containing protein [Burkholderiaceae bacterium]|nr:DUF3488 and transglutaminase-like domain-containing protein [Burkholderiaceae bacterium]